MKRKKNDCVDVDEWEQLGLLAVLVTEFRRDTKDCGWDIG